MDDKLNTSFKQAAFYLTLMYKESNAQAKRTYNAGYRQSLQDLVEFLLGSSQSFRSASVSMDVILDYCKQKHDQMNAEEQQQANQQQTPQPPSSNQMQQQQLPPITHFTFESIPLPTDDYVHIGGGKRRTDDMHVDEPQRKRRQ